MTMRVTHRSARQLGSIWRCCWQVRCKHRPRSPDAWAATVYGARISSETGWEDIILDPIGADFVDAYLVAGAISRPYAFYRDGALSLEAEGQVVYNFGDQDHWEFNVVPIVVRWHKFPWSHRVETSAAFGLGLSYATELPEVEVEIEGESQQLLIYWVMELTAGRCSRLGRSRYACIIARWPGA